MARLVRPLQIKEASMNYRASYLLALHRWVLRVALSACAVAACSTTSAIAATTLSANDQAFVAKVGQGGMFEVEASKVAEDKAKAQDLKDQATTEVHDHELVGEKLKSITSANGVDLPSKLNSDFQSRVDRLRTLSGDAFDKAYLTEMVRIHAMDGAAFAKEAKTGDSPDLRAFASETVRIVERHIGALHGTDKAIR